MLVGGKSGHLVMFFVGIFFSSRMTELSQSTDFHGLVVNDKIFPDQNILGLVEKLMNQQTKSC